MGQSSSTLNRGQKGEEEKKVIPLTRSTPPPTSHHTPIESQLVQTGITRHNQTHPLLPKVLTRPRGCRHPSSLAPSHIHPYYLGPALCSYSLSWITVILHSLSADTAYPTTTRHQIPPPTCTVRNARKNTPTLTITEASIKIHEGNTCWY